MFELRSDTSTEKPIIYKNGTSVHKASATRKEVTSSYVEFGGRRIRNTLLENYPGISMTDAYHRYNSPTHARLVAFAEGSKMKNLGIDQALLEVSNEFKGKSKTKKLSFIVGDEIIRDFNMRTGKASIAEYMKFLGDLTSRGIGLIK